MTEPNGHHEWPLLMEGAPGERSDDRADNVRLLETDYETPGEESKRTAELIESKHGNYWYIIDWERYDFEGSPTWFNRSGFSVDIALIDQLTKLGAAP